MIVVASALCLAADPVADAVALYEAKRYPEAAALLEKTIAESPGIRMDAYVHLLKCYSYLFDYTAMLRVSRQALRISRKQYEVFYFKSYAHYYRGEYDAAFEEIQKAIALNSENAFLYNFLGLIHLKKNELPPAAAAFASATQRASWNPIYQNNAGDVYALQGNYQKAYEAYLKAASLDPESKTTARSNAARLAGLLKKQ